ncbi:MAG: hypothetical protein ACK41F_01975 [Fimbriimonadaceae bacterium]
MKAAVYSCLLVGSIVGCSMVAEEPQVKNAEEAPKVQTRKGMEVMGAEAQLTEAGMQGDSRVGSKLQD